MSRKDGRSFAREGRTILFVSHNHAAIRSLCSHGLVLRAGSATPKLDIQSALEQYSSHHKTTASSWKRPKNLDKPSVHFKSIDVRLQGLQPKLLLSCSVRIRSTSSGRPVFIAVDILDKNSAAIMQAEPRCEPFIGGAAGTYSVDLSIELPALVPGIYYLDFWIGSHNEQTIELDSRCLIYRDNGQSKSQKNLSPHTGPWAHRAIFNGHGIGEFRAVKTKLTDYLK